MTARVYDKAFEALQKRGEILPPTARVEVTAAGGDCGATLRDAAEPTALFWHIASPAILTRPEGIPVWSPNSDIGWQLVRLDISPAEVLKRRVANATMLDALADVADEIGPEGRKYLLGLLRDRLMPEEARKRREELRLALRSSA
ncbi:hypothetical protein [Pseudomonas aeruginosa]|uniref:hypothetical protein n=1 Tax=Pseudomonas aeruginosa TaxID=287 RepID=UPI0028A396C2|nr:hypothetical protein [Pseudomonas aeruginosa]HDY6823534.1 hypothetical protein [Pseudomonas aeruginosa]